MYDYLVVGAGPFGSIFAYEAKKRGKKVQKKWKKEEKNSECAPPLFTCSFVILLVF